MVGNCAAVVVWLFGWLIVIACPLCASAGSRKTLMLAHALNLLDMSSAGLLKIVHAQTNDVSNDGSVAQAGVTG